MSHRWEAQTDPIEGYARVRTQHWQVQQKAMKVKADICRGTLRIRLNPGYQQTAHLEIDGETELLLDFDDDELTNLLSRV